MQGVEAMVNALPIRWQRITKQFIKFGVTGTIGAVVDFSTYFLITRGLHFDQYYLIAGQKIIIANNISVLLAIISNFVFNKYWTFRDTSSQIMRQWTGYFILNVFTWILNQLLVSIFAFQVAVIGQVFGNLRDVAAKVLAIGIILLFNFAGSKFIIFNKSPNNLR